MRNSKRVHMKKWIRRKLIEIFDGTSYEGNIFSRIWWSIRAIDDTDILFPFWK